MAKKRSHKKKTTRRHHRRVGAMSMNPKSPVVQIASLAAGYFLGDTVNNMLDKATGGKVDSKIIAAGEVGLGAMLVLSKKKTMLKTIGGGIVAGAGLKRGLKAFGIISGYGAVPVIGRRRMAGYGAVPVIGAGYAPGAAQLNGYKAGDALGNMPVHKQVLGSTGLMRGGE